MDAKAAIDQFKSLVYAELDEDLRALVEENPNMLSIQAVVELQQVRHLRTIRANVQLLLIGA